MNEEDTLLHKEEEHKEEQSPTAFFEYEEDTDSKTSKSAEMQLNGALLTPWDAITSASPPPLPSFTPGMPSRGRERFTRKRLVAFASIVVAVAIIFGGGVFALVNSTHRPASAAPVAAPAEKGQEGGKEAQPVVTRPAVVGAPTPGTNGQAIIQDTFARPDAAPGWGQVGGDAWQQTNLGGFSIINHTGNIHNTNTANAQPVFYTALLGPATAQTMVDTQLTFVMQQFDGKSNLGIVLRWQDNQHYYKAYLNGSNLVIIKNVGGQQTLNSLTFAASAGVSYTLRFRSDTGALMAKAWRADQPEPGNWLLMAQDTTLTSGKTGVRALLVLGNSASLSLFQVTQ